MDRGVIYYLHGNGYLPRLLASVASLRHSGNYWPVTVCVSSELSSDIADGFAKCAIVAPVIVQPIYPVLINGKICASATKSQLHRYSHAQKTIFLDCDTIVIADLEGLWPQSSEVVVTNYAGWACRGGLARARWVRWKPFVPRSLYNRIMIQNSPMLNSGAFGFARNTAIMEPWHRLVVSSAGAFEWCNFVGDDELMLQLLLPDYAYRLLDDSWNCSNRHGLNWDKAKIIHYNKSSHLKGRGKTAWAEAFGYCWKNNVANCRSWLPSIATQYELAVIGVKKAVA